MEVTMTGMSVMIAMPVFGDIPAATVRCMMQTQAACLKHGIVLDVEMSCGSTVFHARSMAAHRFLKSKCDRMFMIDADMVWKTDDFFRLLALSTQMECVSSTYTARGEPPRFYVGISDVRSIVPNEFGCMPIDGVGLGFTVVSRKLIQELADRAPKITFKVNMPGERVAKIFRFDEDEEGEARGEDMAFFADVKALGYQPYLDHSIELGHIGSKEYRGRFADQLVKVA